MPEKSPPTLAGGGEQRKQYAPPRKVASTLGDDIDVVDFLKAGEDDAELRQPRGRPGAGADDGRGRGENQERRERRLTSPRPVDLRLEIGAVDRKSVV